MVVNKKQNTPVAPPMGSRTNSTQPLPRTKATLNSKLTTAGPSSTSKKPKQKKHTKASKSTKSSSIVDRVVIILLTIFTTYALWTCPADTHLSNPLCRSLSQYRTHVLDPYVLPPLQKALSHPSIAPAVAKYHDAERVVTPVIRRTRVVAQPYITKAAKLAVATYEKVLIPIYIRSIQPSYRKYVLPQYKRHVLPRVRLVRSRVIDPYFTPFSLKAHQYTNRALVTAHRIYILVTPRIQTAYAHTRPFVGRAWEKAKPHLTNAVEICATFFGLALDKSVEARRQFVDPHVVRIWAKVVELSGTTVPSSMTVAPASTSTIVEETKATSSEIEPETVQTISSAAPSATTSNLSVVPDFTSEAASVPEESSLPVETSTSSSVETLSSVASVMEASSTESAPSLTSSAIMETLLVEAETEPEIEVEVEAEPETEVEAETEPETEVEAEAEPEFEVEVEAESEPEVVVEEAVPPQEDDLLAEDEAEAAPEVVEEVDLDDFFAELGLLEDEEAEPEPSIVEEEPETVTVSLTPEESLAARKAKTAAKRAKIEADLDKWQLEIDALIKGRTKAFRKEMVRIRKGAVRALFPDPEKGDNGDLEETLTHVRGEDVAGILGRFENESEKLLKGLETYLKKEEKSVRDSATVDVDDRIRRWYTVVERVEERFTERLAELQEKVQWWYLSVRELEVQEYHRATKEVKEFTNKAQGEMAMPMAWLDDITYKDWQRYHDFMRAHERFDEQIRMIQNGSHPSPPIDPLVPALDKLQRDLEDVASGFKIQVRTYGVQINDILAPPQNPVEETGEESVSAEEEQVSILPIDPVQTSPVEEEQGAFDASKIILGKSPEQVEEAMSIAQELLHEEL